MSKQKMMTLSMLGALCVLTAMSMHAKAAGQDGMVAVRDAQTGKLRAPTPDELRELRAKAPPSAAALSGVPRANQPLARRDGARGMRLGEKSLVYEVVTRGQDGKLDSRCVQGEAAARAALQQPANTEHEEHRHESR